MQLKSDPLALLRLHSIPHQSDGGMILLGAKFPIDESWWASDSQCLKF